MENNGMECKIIHKSKFYNHLTDGVVITTELLMLVHPKGADVIFKQFNSLSPDTPNMMLIDTNQLDLIIESLIDISNTINNVN